MRASLMAFLMALTCQIMAQVPSNNCNTNVNQEITVGSSCNSFFFDVSSNIGAPALVPCIGIGATGLDGWGWFTATATSTTIDYLHYNDDVQIYVYTGACGALTQIACADDWGIPLFWETESVTIATVIGQTYWVRIAGIYGWAGIVFGDLCVYSFTPATNDDCADAITLNCGDVLTGSTVGATADPIPTGCYIDNSSPGVWYTFTGTGLNVTASMCVSGFDTQLSLLTGSCGSWTCLTYNDDFCGVSSQVSLQTVLGTTYYLYVSGLFDSGDFTLSLTCELPPGPACFDTEINGCPDIDLEIHRRAWNSASRQTNVKPKINVRTTIYLCIKAGRPWRYLTCKA